jgi:hypothetical protein
VDFWKENIKTDFKNKIKDFIMNFAWILLAIANLLPFTEPVGLRKFY